MREALAREGVALLTSRAGRTPTTVSCRHDGERAMVTYEPGSTTRADDVAAFEPRAVIVGIDQLDVVPDGASVYVTCGDDDARAFAGRPPRRPAPCPGAVRQPPRGAPAHRPCIGAEAARRALGERVPIAVVTLRRAGRGRRRRRRAAARAGFTPARRGHHRRRRPLLRGVRVGGPRGCRSARTALSWAVLYAALSVSVPTGAGGAVTQGRLDRGGASRRGLPPLAGKGEGDRMRVHRVAASSSP